MKRYLVLTLLLLIAGCSSTTFFYNRLHIFIPWYVDDYVDLNGRQDDVLRQLLVDYLDRHRLEHLPRYVAIIDSGLANLDEPELTDEIARLYGLLERELELVQRESLDWMLTLGDQLTEKQMAEFIASLHDKQQEYEEEYLERDEEEFRDETRDNLEDNLTDYLGGLNDRQEAILLRAVGDLRRWDRIWLAERKNWIDRLSAALARRPGWRQDVRTLVETRYDSAPPGYRAAFEHNLSLMLGAVTEIIEIRTERQDRHLRRELGALRDDLCSLIRQGLEERTPEQSPVTVCAVAADQAESVRS